MKSGTSIPMQESNNGFAAMPVKTRSPKKGSFPNNRRESVWVIPRRKRRSRAVNQTAPVTVDPVKNVKKVRKRTFSGEVAVFAFWSGKNPQFPCFARLSA
jgi:hypothetical protein